MDMLTLMRQWDRQLPGIALASAEVREIFEAETNAASYDLDADEKRRRKYRFSFYAWAKNRYGLEA